LLVPLALAALRCDLETAAFVAAAFAAHPVCRRAEELLSQHSRWHYLYLPYPLA
jgi:hypothetical protein